MIRTHAPALPWYEDMEPGSGGLEPRAWYADSDAGRMSLNGEWRFRLSPGAATRDESFARPGFDASGWATVGVPGHWVLQGGGGAPACTNVGSCLEDQDQWWLPGIFRDVTLLERPRGAPRDFFVHTGYDHRDGSAGHCGWSARGPRGGSSRPSWGWLSRRARR